MRFTRLRLAGFKSFVEPTEFHIEPGLTGIVGPNGCGKSNLLEAMRWVMGESSSRNMRAADMDDVIFSGSGSRASRNAAEVLLAVDEVDGVDIQGVAPADSYEITRKLDRGSGSTYRINGREVRARDVQILFADASTGSRSPAMVRQGQISELIAAKPSARRAVLEEASGVAGLHGRRNEAEIRLRAAEVNLERLGDVQSTLTTQMEGLERQARQASRYRNLSAEIRSLEAGLSYQRWREAHGQRDEAERVLVAARSALAAAATAQSAASRNQAVAAAALSPARQAEADAGAALARTRRAIGDAEDELKRAEGRLEDLGRTLQTIAADRAREERLGTDTAAALDRLHAEADALRAASQDDPVIDQRLQAALAAAEATLAEAEARHSEAQANHARAVAAREAAERLARERAERQRRLEQAAATSLADVTRLAAMASGDGELAAARLAAEAAAAQVLEAERAVDAAAVVIQGARAGEGEARRLSGDAERQHAALVAEIGALKRLVSTPDGSRWLPVLDRVSVEPGLERALAAALAEDLDLPTDSRAPSHWRVVPGVGDPALPDGVRVLGRHASAPDELQRRLGQTGLVARADAPGLMAELKTGQVLVSVEGDVWRWDGVVASAEAPTPAARRLEARNRLRDLEGQVAAEEASRTSARDRLSAASRTLSAADAAERAARDSVRSAARRDADARAALAELERRAAGHAARLSSAEAEQARRQRELDEFLADARAAPAEVLPDVAAVRAALEVARATVEDARRVAAEARAARAAAVQVREARARRLAAISEEEAGWQRRVADAGHQIAVLTARAAEADAQRAALAGRPDELRAQRRQATGLLSGHERARAEAGERLAAAEAVARDAELAARLASDALSGAREHLARAEERLAGAEARRADVEARIRESFEIEPALLATLAGVTPGGPAQDLSQIERRLERSRQERERMGPVNLRADDEIREIRGRADDLAREQADLIEAVKRLRAGIAQIDEEARARLRAAFEVVDGHFRALFTQLFGGGEAELRLVDHEDPLQAGLEIYARPPGKKPSTMSLLSGGEQALTAIALIFAVFLTNPAPVCVLDEVDAPLDDANVERWCDLLSDMASRTRTRFLIITHNPITMARMNRLFGVTMAERGVSQLVSVDLDVAESLLDSAGASAA